MRFNPGSSMVSSMSDFLDNKTKEDDIYSVGINTGGEVADFSEKHFSVGNKIHRFFHSQPVAAPALILLSSIIVFGFIVGDRFFHPYNFSLILQQVTIIGILAVAQTLIILTAGIDLSVGAIMVISSVVMGRLAVDYGFPPVLAIMVGLLVGAFFGALNGFFVVRFKMPPMIVTLGTWNIIYALNIWYSNSETIRSGDVKNIAPLLQWTGNSFNFLGGRLTYGSILMVLLFVAIWYALNWTAWGRHVYATGDDPEAATLTGIRIDRILMSVYTLAGVICAFCGWVIIGRIGAISPASGTTANLDSITAVVIGGTSFFGGRGSIYGALFGALIVGVFRNGLALAGLDVLWQEFTVGALIIIAVAVDQWIRRVGS